MRHNASATGGARLAHTTELSSQCSRSCKLIHIVCTVLQLIFLLMECLFIVCPLIMQHLNLGVDADAFRAIATGGAHVPRIHGSRLHRSHQTRALSARCIRS